jgi:hypothetical protein
VTDSIEARSGQTRSDQVSLTTRRGSLSSRNPTNFVWRSLSVVVHSAKSIRTTTLGLSRVVSFNQPMGSRQQTDPNFKQLLHIRAAVAGAAVPSRPSGSVDLCPPLRSCYKPRDPCWILGSEDLQLARSAIERTPAVSGHPRTVPARSAIVSFNQPVHSRQHPPRFEQPLHMTGAAVAGASAPNQPCSLTRHRSWLDSPTGGSRLSHRAIRYHEVELTGPAAEREGVLHALPAFDLFVITAPLTD